MEIVFEDNNKRKITSKERVLIHPKSAGFHLLQISARAKGEKQLGGTDDEDLKLEFLGHKFDAYSPASFSGGELHDGLKTVYFVCYLEAQEYPFQLIPDDNAPPFLEKICLWRVGNSSDGELNLELNTQAEDRNRRPWITFVLVDLALKTFSLAFNLKRRFIDSDDVKIIVDGKTIRNNRDIFRKWWYLVASILTGEEQKAQFNVNLPWGLHYIELWADRMPTLLSTRFVLGGGEEGVRSYIDRRFGRDYNQFDGYILEAVSYWNEFFAKQDYPVPVPLDPNLVKAIIYRESRLGYYPQGNIIDVMQVWDPANPAKSAILGDSTANEFVSPGKIAHMSYSYPKDKIPLKVENPRESIFWGVRWLYHKAQYLFEKDGGTSATPYERKWRSWEEAVRAYNGNPRLGEEYVKEVFSVYEKGLDSEGNKLW